MCATFRFFNLVPFEKADFWMNQEIAFGAHIISFSTGPIKNRVNKLASPYTQTLFISSLIFHLRFSSPLSTYLLV